MATVNEIRTWALDAGLEPGARGRLPKAVKVAYLEAHAHEVRELAKAQGLAVPKRGRVGHALIEQVLNAKP